MSDAFKNKLEQIKSLKSEVGKEIEEEIKWMFGEIREKLNDLTEMDLQPFCSFDLQFYEFFKKPVKKQKKKRKSGPHTSREEKCESFKCFASQAGVFTHTDLELHFEKVREIPTKRGYYQPTLDAYMESGHIEKTRVDRKHIFKVVKDLYDDGPVLPDPN